MTNNELIKLTEMSGFTPQYARNANFLLEKFAELLQRNSAPAWISVKDRLPAYNVECLVSFCDSDSLGEPLHGVASLQTYAKSKDKMIWHGQGGSHDAVTHWMPILPIEKVKEIGNDPN